MRSADQSWVIINLKDAIEYMKAAPHDFGGHKEDAIRASEEAVRQLHFALEYRENATTVSFCSGLP